MLETLIKHLVKYVLVELATLGPVARVMYLCPEWTLEVELYLQLNSVCVFTACAATARTTE